VKKKSRIFRLTVFFCLCAMILNSTVILTSAAAPSMPDLTEANAVYFRHLESGTLVCEKNATQSVPAGSSVKVLSGLLLCNLLGNRQNETVYVTEDMIAESSGRRLNIKADDVIPLTQLLYAAICGSYNDAFDVLAYYATGSRNAFVEMMNQYAQQLGAAQSQFTDPSGVADSSRTTAEDIGKIAAAATQNELYMELCTTVSYVFQATDKISLRTIYNPNELLSKSQSAYNSVCRGMSAGMTTLGGGCVVTMAKSGTESYVSVILGGAVTSDGDRDVNHAYAVTNRLVKWVYSTYTYLEVISPKTELCKIPVTVSDITSSLDVRTKDTCSLYLPKSYEIGTDVTYSIRLNQQSIEAPVADGTFVGYVAILHDGQTLATVPIYTVGTAERSGFVSRLKQMRTWTGSRTFLAGAIFFVSAMALWITIESLRAYRIRHKWDKYFSMKMNPPPRPSANNKRKK